MTKLTVTIDLDMDAYREKYGPGTEWWALHRAKTVRISGGGWRDIQDPPETYEFDKNPKLVEEMVRNILEEGFYDWACQGWLKVDVG